MYLGRDFSIVETGKVGRENRVVVKRNQQRYIEVSLERHSSALPQLSAALTRMYDGPNRRVQEPPAICAGDSLPLLPNVQLLLGHIAQFAL